MKKLLNLFAFSLAFCSSFAQTESSGKYKIDLPRYWKHGDKVWEYLTDKLPVIWTELKDRQLCTDKCKPDYFVSLQLSETFILGYDAKLKISTQQFEEYEIKTYFSVNAFLILKNAAGEIIHKYPVSDSTEVAETVTGKYRVDLPRVTQTNYFGSSQQRRNTVQANQQQNFKRASDTATPQEYIEENKERLQPRLLDIYSMVSKKLSEKLESVKTSVN